MEHCNHLYCQWSGCRSSDFAAQRQTQVCGAAIGALLFNLAIILGIFLARGGPVEIIAYATVFGSLLPVIWQFWLLYRENVFEVSLKAAMVFDTGVAREFLRAVTPVAILISVLPFIPVYERYLLSMQATGSVATLNYAEKLFNLPLGIISISLAHVILPSLSLLHGHGRLRFLGRMGPVSQLWRFCRWLH